MHKKSKKLLSVLVAALILFSTVGAYAFSFDEYDNAQGDAFVADYYANKDSYYKTDTGLARFPAYAQPHKLYTDAQMQTEGVNNFIPVVEQALQDEIVKVTKENRTFNRVIEYEDAGVLGTSKNFSDHDGMGMVNLSRNFIGASQIRMPYYPLQRGLKKTPAEVNVDEYTNLYNFWLTPDDAGKYATMASFYPDGDGTIYFVAFANAPGMESQGEWEKITQDLTKSTLFGKVSGRVGSEAFLASNKNYPLTLINDVEYSWMNLQQIAKAAGSVWMDSTADMPLTYTHERVFMGTNGEDGGVDVSNTLFVYKRSFTEGQLVELPTPAKAGVFGTFLIKWNDRADTRAELNSLAYKINGEGDAVSVANFDSATKTYDVNVGHGAAFVTLEAKGTGMVEKPEAVDFTKGSATAKLTVTAADGVTKQTYTVNFTAPQFESELAAPDAICYYTPSSPISVKNEAKVLVEGYHQKSETTELSIKLFANQSATKFEVKKQYDTSASLTDTDAAYPEMDMSFVLYNMTKGTKSVDAEVGDTVKVISTRQADAKTYRNVYTIHIGQFDKAYGYDDGNITLTLAPELKTSGSIAVNPSALSARVPLFSDRYPQHALAFAGKFVKGATHIALPLNDSNRSGDAAVKAYHMGDNLYFTVTASKAGTIYLASQAGNVSTNHTKERGWKTVSNTYKNYSDAIVNANENFTGGLSELEALTQDISIGFDEAPLGFYRNQYGSTINGVYRIGDRITPKNVIDRTRALDSKTGKYSDKIISPIANRTSSQTMVFRHFEAGEEIQIYTLGGNYNENIIPFIVWDDAVSGEIDSADKVKNLTLNADFAYTSVKPDVAASTGLKKANAWVYGSDGLPGAAYYVDDMTWNSNYQSIYVVQDNITLGENVLGKSTLAYSDRTNMFLNSSNTSQYFAGGTVIRRPKGESGPTVIDKDSENKDVIIRGSKEQPYYTGAFDGKNGNPYWMSFTVTSGATVFVSAHDGTWYNAPSDWTKAKPGSLKLRDISDIYYKHYAAGETVNIPNYGWDDEKLTETTCYWDPSVFAIVWDSQGKVNPDTLSSDATLSSIKVNGEPVAVVAEQKAYDVEVSAEALSAVLDVTANDAGAKVTYGDGSENANVATAFPASITVTVTASNGTAVEYTFHFKQAAQKAKLVVSANGGGKIMSVVGSASQADWATGKEAEFVRGTKFTLTAMPEAGNKFLYWVDADSNRIVSEEDAYSFYLGAGRNLNAVFGEAGTDTKTVIFKNKNNQVVLHTMLKEGSVTVPSEPMYMGYQFGGWLKNNMMTSIKSGDSIAYGTLAAGETVYTAGYTKTSNKYTVTVTGGTLADGKTEGSYTYDTLLTVKLDASAVPAGKKFAYWTKEGKTVSYNATYSFYMGAAATAVEAVYVDEGETVTAEPIVAAYAPVILEDGKIAFFAERSLDSALTLVESGILLYDQPGYFDIATNGVIRAAATSKENAGQFTVRKANVSAGDTWRAKAYAIYLDGEGGLKYIFSDAVEETYPAK